MNKAGVDTFGTFDATEEFVDAVVSNPVLEGWGNQLVVISAGE